MMVEPLTVQVMHDVVSHPRVHRRKPSPTVRADGCIRLSIEAGFRFMSAEASAGDSNRPSDRKVKLHSSVQTNPLDLIEPREVLNHPRNSSRGGARRIGN